MPQRSVVLYRLYAVFLGLIGFVGIGIRYIRPGIKTPGWDFVVYCDAAAAFRHGANPYLVENLARSTLSFVYPPATLPLFAGLCAPSAVVSPVVVHSVLYGVLLFGSGILVYTVDPAPDGFLLATFLIVGFGGTYRAFETGNLSILLAFVLTIAFAALLEERDTIVGVALAAIAAFKLYPIFFGAPLLVSGQSRSEKARTIGAIVVTVAAFAAVNVVTFSAYIGTYYRSITGQLPQHSPAGASGGRVNPALYHLVKDLNRFIGGTPLMRWLLYLGVVVLVAALFCYYVRHYDIDTVEVFSLGIIAVLLVLPRLKPYTLVIASVPAYFLVRDATLKTKTVALTIVAAIPAAVIPLQVVIGDGLWFYRLLLPVRTPIDYAPSIMLLAFFIFVVMDRAGRDQARRVSEPAAT